MRNGVINASSCKCWRTPLCRVAAAMHRLMVESRAKHTVFFCLNSPFRGNIVHRQLGSERLFGVAHVSVTSVLYIKIVLMMCSRAGTLQPNVAEM